MKENRILLKLTLTIIIALTVTGAATQPSKPEPVQSYGNANVTSVLRLDEHVRLYCDIADLPPIIGQDIPVCIKGLKPAANPQDNLKLLMFLDNLFLSKDNKPRQIVLKDIQRGERFCLVADIEVDGQDLCDMLVDKKLTQKIIEVPQDQTATPIAHTAAGVHYIASKSSKVYHRSTCPHAKRMDTAKVVTFTTSNDAEQTGRRPCKTCKP